MAIDILPTEVPFDASEHFSQALLPYLRALLRHEQERHGFPTTEDVTGDAAERLSALKRATIAENGELTESHRWLYEPLRDVGLVTLPPSHSDPSIRPSPSSPSSYSPSSVARSRTDTTPKVLLFGSGMVAKPFCQTILNHGRKNGDVQLVVASNNIAEASALVRGHQRASAIEVDITDKVKVGALVKSADIVARYASDYFL
jgi:alpha-aminoadipic semialdehyde synthase